MKFTGTRTVKVLALRLPGDIARRRKAPHVKELSASIEQNGLAHLPIIDSTFSPVVGRDRIAALMELGRKSIEVRTCEGTADELEALEIAENLHRRRDDVDEMRARYVAIMERKYALEMPKPAESLERDAQLNEAPSPKGRPASPRGAAVKATAKAEGVTERAVQASVARAEAKAVRPVVAPPPPVPEAPVEMWGMPTEGVDFTEVIRVQGILRAADKLIQQAQRTLTTLKGTERHGNQVYGQTYERVQEAGQIVRENIPEALCPYCKGMPKRVAVCRCCSGLGYVSSSPLEFCPPQLKVRGLKAVVSDSKGGFLSVIGDRADEDDVL